MFEETLIMQTSRIESQALPPGDKDLNLLLPEDIPDADYFNRAGDALLEQGKYTEAEEQYRKALQMNGSLARTCANLAGALLRQSRSEEARPLAFRAIELGVTEHWVFQELDIDSRGENDRFDFLEI